MFPLVVRAVLVAGVFAVLAPRNGAETAWTFEIQADGKAGTVRALHGINKGPVANGGLIRLDSEMRKLGVPSLRLHDCQWPYPDVVDIHAVFRNADADPADPANFDFLLTDEYVEAASQTGADLVYRLGESIEHGTHKRWVHPPKDPEKWAAICRGLIRHYNEGWANGKRLGIRYWEIWNEPENRPEMWTGSDAEYFRLYEVTANAIRKEFSHIRIGGPAVGNLGKCDAGSCTASPFVRDFIEHCQSRHLPLDFFSWHTYTDRPEEFVQKARAVRKWLDDAGFLKTEIHLNEWNYLPDNSWNGLSRNASPQDRKRMYSEMSGVRAAAFVAEVLIRLQDSPVDVANFFHGETGGFGLFDEHGIPYPVFHAFSEFQKAAKTAHRLPAKQLSSGSGPEPILLAAASQTPGKIILIASRYSNPTANIHLHFPNRSIANLEIHGFDPQGVWKVLETGIDRTKPLSIPLTPLAIVELSLRP